MIKNNTSELYINQLVIHLKHGLGRYQGLITIKYNNLKNEYLTILYANNVKLYVPIYHLYLIKPYIIKESNKNIKLHKLGCNKWKKERKKIFQNIQDYAVKILDTHVNRITKLGFSFKINSKKYINFCNDFPFKMTKDQVSVMQSVLSDMKKNTPMDRLICGDVGFGKTEIALRASFIAVDNKKQVVVLTPTTLLTQQHYKNFKKRFSNFLINIDILSRFNTKKEQINCIKKLKKGEINILIGTHKILFNHLKWFDLGLLIIDEEHRFGVYQKESIKKKFSNIDILTLTATPIPRTLHMAFNGMCNLSVISTPPNNRLPVKTFIKKYDILLVKKIILKELSRQGQVYYVCNKVKYLKEKLIKLKKIMPKVKFNTGHGKMASHELKKIMHDFYKKKFNVLICTTIIETGIDIPNVNSIIIENANSFGLAQLHQMRGRVGRSNIQAYAWLLIDKNKTLSLNEKKRLNAISSIKDFGAGLSLSVYDLQIRGFGELLGYHQSGHKKNIEISLYLKLLKKTIELNKKNTTLSLQELKNNEPEIKLFVPIILPKKYIENTSIRLYFYKKIFSVKKKYNLYKIKLELINKFGPMPEEAKNLILVSYIKILCNYIGIKKIQCNNNIFKIKFSKNHKISKIDILIKICSTEFKEWKMENSYSLKFIYYHCSFTDRIYSILKFLKKIKIEILNLKKK